MSTLNPLLLQTLAASGGNANSSIQEMLLSQLGDQDPTVSLLAKYLTQNQANDEEEEEEEEDDDASIQSTQEAEATYSQELEAAQVRNQKLVNIARQLWQELEDLDSELEDLRDRNDALAQALGACHLCWGEDLACEVCHGQGYPGSFPADPDMYRQYVTPAVQRLQRSRGVRGAGGANARFNHG